MHDKCLLLDKLPGFVFYKRIDSVYLGCNQAMADLVGLGHPEAIVGLTDNEIFEDQTLAERYLNDDKSLLEKKSLTSIEPTQNKMGNTFQVLTAKTLDYDNHGCPKGIIVQAMILPKECQLNLSKRKTVVHTYQGLTRKESEIVYYLMHHNTPKDIAHKFNRSARTVEKHIENIKLKLGVNDKKAIIESVMNSNENSLLSIAAWECEAL